MLKNFLGYSNITITSLLSIGVNLYENYCLIQHSLSELFKIKKNIKLAQMKKKIDHRFEENEATVLYSVRFN